MARIEDLVGLVTEEALRAELAAEVAELKRRRNFGLVFERHLPEETLLANAPMRPGVIVVRRSDPTNTKLRIVALRGDAALIVPFADPANKSEPEAIRRRDLLILKRFGEAPFPTLAPLEVVGRGDHDRHQVVIEGENYHALELLSFALEGRFDVIYLDPPYNTGAQDWTYNNNFVDSNDTWRHSKWLSFMEKRLRLVRRALHQDGVIVVTIDEREVHHLGMLLEQMFPEARVQMASIVINPIGQDRGSGLARVDEQAFFCFFGNAPAPAGLGDDLLNERADSKRARSVRWEWLIRGGSASSRDDRAGLFYPVLVDPDRKCAVGCGPVLLGGDPDPDARIDGCLAVWPIRTDGSWGRWRIGPTKLAGLIEKGYVRLGGYDARRKTWTILYVADSTADLIETGAITIAGRDANGVVSLDYANQRKFSVKTVWNRARHNAGVYGSHVLTAFIGDRNTFSFPKSLYAVRDTIEILTHEKPDALILDAFAGSGTTLHATVLLNAQDGGRRQCVLVTNNEVNGEKSKALNKAGHFRGDPEFEAEGVFQSATRHRLIAAVTGQRADGKPVEGAYLDDRPYAEGFEENVAFFRLDYLDRVRVELGLEFERLLPTLWLAAGARGTSDGFDPALDFHVAKDGRFAVLFRTAGIEGLLAELDGRPDVTHVFVVTDSEEGFAEVAERLPTTVSPRMLWRDYLRAFSTGIEAGR